MSIIHYVTRRLRRGCRFRCSTGEAYDDWRSVVARGAFHRIPEDENTVPAEIFAAYFKIASPEVFHQKLKHLDFDWFELRIDDLTGRQMSNE